MDWRLIRHCRNAESTRATLVSRLDAVEIADLETQSKIDFRCEMRPPCYDAERFSRIIIQRAEASRMGVQTDVVIADMGDAQAIANTATPTAEWEGFTFNGFHHVQVCTLLSLLEAGSPDAEFQRYLGEVEPAAVGADEGPVVVGIKPEQVADLAAVARLDEGEFEALAASWAATEEFEGWSGSDVRALLRELGDLAESALLAGKCLMLWQSL